MKTSGRHLRNLRRALADAEDQYDTYTGLLNENANSGDYSETLAEFYTSQVKVATISINDLQNAIRREEKK